MKIIGLIDFQSELEANYTRIIALIFSCMVLRIKNA